MSFSFDTSGYVEHPHGSNDVSAIYWSDLSPFEQGYVEELFEASMDDITEERRREGNRLALGFSDFSPEALAMILRDCERFGDAPIGQDPFLRDAPRSDVAAKHWLAQRGDDTARRAGAALWAYRNGNRDAFFNKGIFPLVVNDSVERLAKTFPPLTVSLSDDGKVHLAVAS